MVLGLASAAPLLRYTRASMLDVMDSEYVTTAKAKGLAPRTVIARHAFRNSLIPIITVVGLLLPELVAGAVITEQIFAWPGMGQLAVRAASDRDPALMMGVVLVIGAGVLVTNILVDVAYVRRGPAGSALTAPADAVGRAAGRHVRAVSRSPARQRGASCAIGSPSSGSVLLAMIVLMAMFADVISSKPFFTDVKAVSRPAQRQPPAGDRSLRPGRLGTRASSAPGRH